MPKNKQIEITLVKSPIGYNISKRKTLEALGLKKLNQKILKNNNPQIIGMVRKVHHLVEVKEL